MTDITLYQYGIQVIQEWRDDKGDIPVGIRRLHYRIVSLPEDRRMVLRQRNLDGNKVWVPEPYQNNKQCYNSLIDAFTKARLNGDIPSAWIIDEKNDDPIWMPGRKSVSADYIYQIKTRTGEAPEISYTPMPEWSDLLNGIHIGYRVNGGKFNHQEHRIAVFIEKATNRDALTRVCARHGADLFIFSGQASTTRAIDFALAAKEEDKPVCLLYIHDADPGGMTMMDAVIKKVRTIYPRDDHICERVALSPEQIRKYNLPPAFSVDDKKYAPGTKAIFETEYEGLEPRELDALDEDVLIQELESVLSKYSNLNKDQEEIDAAKEQARFQVGMLDDEIVNVLSPFESGYQEIQEKFNQTCSEIETVTAHLREELISIRNQQDFLLWDINQAIKRQGINEFEQYWAVHQ